MAYMASHVFQIRMSLDIFRANADTEPLRAACGNACV
jgi:hypothetical protein